MIMISKLLLIFLIFFGFSIQSCSSSCGYFEKVKSLQCFETVLEAESAVHQFRANDTMENELQVHGKCQLFLSCFTAFPECLDIFQSIKIKCEEIMEGGRFEECVDEILTYSPDYSTCMSLSAPTKKCSKEQLCSSSFATSLCEGFLAEILKIRGIYSIQKRVPSVCIQGSLKVIV